MRLPNRDQAHVERGKLTDYLLNINHPDAKGKSTFFHGHYGSVWKRLRDDLLDHATGSVTSTEETRHGTLYVIEKTLRGTLVRSVWILRKGESFPPLVTAYPIE
jgi:hypothetical protein